MADEINYNKFKSKDLHVYPTSTRDYKFDQVAQTLTPFNIANIVKTSIDQNFAKDGAGCTVITSDETNKKIQINSDTFIINGYRIELLNDIIIETTVLGNLYIGIVPENITVGNGSTSTSYTYSELSVLDETQAEYSASKVTGLGYCIGTNVFSDENSLNLGTIGKNNETGKLTFTPANTLQSISYNRLYDVVIDDGEL